MKVKYLCVLLMSLFLLTSCVNITINMPEDKTDKTEMAVTAEDPTEPVQTNIPKEDAGRDVLVEMSSEERKDLNVFLSNFGETLYNPDGYYVGDEGKISFAFIHALINSYDKVFYTSEYMGISAADVDAILNRFFGYSVPHKTPENSKQWMYKEGNFIMRAATGESYSYFSVATKMTKLTDGNYNVDFNIYYATNPDGALVDMEPLYYLNSEQADRMHDYTSSGKAVLRPKVFNGKNTYELVDYEIIR